MTKNRKLVLDKFEEHINAAFKVFCKQHHIQPTTQSLITFLIDKDLIPPVKVKRFTITHEFKELFEKMEIPKSKTVVALSEKFNIPERTIWSILKKEGSS